MNTGTSDEIAALTSPASCAQPTGCRSKGSGIRCSGIDVTTIFISAIRKRSSLMSRAIPGLLQDFSLRHSFCEPLLAPSPTKDDSRGTGELTQILAVTSASIARTLSPPVTESDTLMTLVVGCEKPRVPGRQRSCATPNLTLPRQPCSSRQGRLRTVGEGSARRTIGLTRFCGWVGYDPLITTALATNAGS